MPTLKITTIRLLVVSLGIVGLSAVILLIWWITKPDEMTHELALWQDQAHISTHNMALSVFPQPNSTMRVSDYQKGIYPLIEGTPTDEAYHFCMIAHRINARRIGVVISETYTPEVAIFPIATLSDSATFWNTMNEYFYTEGVEFWDNISITVDNTPIEALAHSSDKLTESSSGEFYLCYKLPLSLGEHTIGVSFADANEIYETHRWEFNLIGE